jgi:homoserine kinase
VLVWCHYEQTGPVLERLSRECRGWADVVRVPFETQGAYVRGL